MADFKQLVAALLIASLCGCQEQRTVEDVFHQGYSAFEADDGATLVRSVRNLERLEPDADHTRLLQALISLRGSDPLTALKLLEQVDADGPLRQLVLLHGATAYYQLRLLHQAQRMLAMLTEEFPDDADGHRWAGVVYYDLGAYDFAVVHLKRVAELEPTDYRPLRLLGIMYCDFERNTEAIDVLSTALTLDPPQHVRLEMIEQLARSRIAERHYDDALELLRSSPVGATGRALIAECLFNLGDSVAALEAIEDALKLDATNRDALLRKAMMFATSGDHERALPILARLVESAPFDSEVRYQYSLTLRALGESQAAEEQILKWQNQKQLADQLTKKNVDALSRPFDAALRLEIADLCDQLGKHDLAAMWRRVAESGPTPDTTIQSVPEAFPLHPQNAE